MTDNQKKYHREYRRKWRLANPERAKEYEKRSRQRNREYRLAYAKEYNKKYWAANKEKLAIKSHEYYEKHSETIKKRVSVYQSEHPEEIRLNKLSRRDRLFGWWYGTVLPSLRCATCGLQDPDCMEFHHPVLRRPYRHKAITSMLNGLNSRSAIEAELSQCVVLCCNCHTREHARLRREAKGLKDGKRYC